MTRTAAMAGPGSAVAAAPGTSARDNRLDIARGLAMALVVLGHAIYGVHNAGLETQTYRFWIIALYTTHMPLFFMISGVLAGSVMRRSWPEFWRNALPKIVWPYFLWSALLTLSHQVMSAYVNSPSEQVDYLSILWRPPAVMWFLYALFFAMILLRFVAPLPRIWGLTVALAMIVVPYTIDGTPQSVRFMGLYIAAALLGKSVLISMIQMKWVLLSALVMMLTLAWAWMDATTPLVGYPAFHWPYIPALLAGPIMLMWVSGLVSNALPPLANMFSYIGQRTMPIFVTHILITSGGRIGLRLAGIENWTLIIVLVTVLGIVLPLLAAWLADRLKLSGLLGWR